MGLWPPPPRSVSSHPIWGPPSGQFLCLLYMEPPQISFFAHYMEASSGQFLRLLYVEAPLDNFLRLLYGAPLRSVSSFTIWGPPQINFFASYVGASSDQFLRILYKGPLRSFSSPIGGPQFSFFAYYIGPPSD